ncbi:tape measure protein [Rhodococcus hoagii]|nr:tape measure protein [Prescottella equi]
MDGEIVAQLLERQIPIYDILGKKMGKNAEEVADMVSKGKVSFKDFSDAMNDKLGGGAVKMATASRCCRQHGCRAGSFGCGRVGARSVVSPLVGYGDGRDRWRYAEGEGVLQGLRCEGVRRVGAEGYRFR